MTMPSTLPIRTRSSRRRTIAGSALALALSAAGLFGAGASPALADGQICGQFDLFPINSGLYNVQNNNYGNHGAQCVTAYTGGFRIDRADGSIPFGGAPKSYSSLVAGCHWTRCTHGNGLPIQASQIGDARTSVTIDTAPGSWNASYDIWFNSTPTAPGQADGTELMIWINGNNAPSPIGSPRGKVTIDGNSYTVWQGDIGWNVISFVRDAPATTVDLPLRLFVDEAISRGMTNPSWWMTSLQFGFELWSHGAGLAARDFSYTPPGNSPTPTPAPAPAPTPAPAPGSGSVTVVGAGSGRCLDVAGRSTADGAGAQLWDCQDSNTAQAWIRRGQTLVNVGSGKCLDVAAAATANGTRVQQWTCLPDAPGQQWQRGPTGTVVNPASDRCLDAAGAGTDNATTLVIWDCGQNKPNQTWAVR